MRLLLCLILLFPCGVAFSNSKTNLNNSKTNLNSSKINLNNSKINLNNSKMDKIIREFEKNGGSKKGVEIIRSHPLKTIITKEDKAQIKQLRKELDKIMLAKSFDTKLFLYTVKKINDLHSKIMAEELFQNQIQILAEVSLEDRKVIYRTFLTKYFQKNHSSRHSRRKKKHHLSRHSSNHSSDDV